MSKSTGNKQRLDILLVERGLFDSRETAKRFIMAGEVLVNEEVIIKPGQRVSEQAVLRVKERPRFVSRGGEKLAAALEAFQIVPDAWICADIGASTGGFTDCLLQAGAAHVYTVDVGYGQLAWSLRQDQRVTVMERTNARYLDALPERVDFVSMDVSFISLSLLFPRLSDWLKPDGQVVALIKPQFEAGKSEVGKGGVVRDPSVHRRVLLETLNHALRSDYHPHGLIPSPLRGPSGNVEFLTWLRPNLSDEPLERMVEAALISIPPE
ncbi:MAG: TlyA family RNA methyltransferase [Chloroflexi bacterium]|nr:TlyA family RNA methyltransferase [Chloroflexota bacterium]